MKPFLCIVMLATLATCALVRADDSAPFPQVGYLYAVRAPKTTPLTRETPMGGSFSWASVKVLAIGPNQWCWVEYDVIPQPAAGKTGPVVIEKHREWLNFAVVTSATPQGDVDYGATYPNGYRIVPYTDGQ